MVLAEVLRVTHNVRDNVKVVESEVERTGNKVENKVRCVDEKVQVVIDGARGVFSWSAIPSNIMLSDGGKQARVTAEEGKLIVQQTAIGVDKITCT